MARNNTSSAAGENCSKGACTTGAGGGGLAQAANRAITKKLARRGKKVIRAILWLDAPYFAALLNRTQQAWREVVAHAVTQGIPVPAMSASLGYYDSLRTARLPANLLQAQRDFFGAHTYERIDKPAGQWFHTDWPEVVG